MIELTFRRHKDDGDMVEIISRDDKTFRRIVWGCVHIDILDGDASLYESLAESGEITVTLSLGAEND